MKAQIVNSTLTNISAPPNTNNSTTQVAVVGAVGTPSNSNPQTLTPTLSFQSPTISRDVSRTDLTNLASQVANDEEEDIKRVAEKRLRKIGIQNLIFFFFMFW